MISYRCWSSSGFGNLYIIYIVYVYTACFAEKFVKKKEKGTAMLKLTWNRYAMLMAMRELLVNANFDIIDYSRQNVYPLYL